MLWLFPRIPPVILVQRRSDEAPRRADGSRASVEWSNCFTARKEWQGCRQLGPRARSIKNFPWYHMNTHTHTCWGFSSGYLCPVILLQLRVVSNRNRPLAGADARWTNPASVRVGGSRPRSRRGDSEFKATQGIKKKERKNKRDGWRAAGPPVSLRPIAQVSFSTGGPDEM